MKKIFYVVFIFLYQSIIAQVYVIKDSLVYYYDKVIEGADGNSFEMLSDYNHAKDKKSFYYKGKKVKNPENFDARKKIEDPNTIYVPIMPYGDYSIKYQLKNEYTTERELYKDLQVAVNSNNVDLKTSDNNYIIDSNYVYLSNNSKIPLKLKNLRAFKFDEENIFFGNKNTMYDADENRWNIDVTKIEKLNSYFLKTSETVMFCEYKDIKFIKADAKTLEPPIKDLPEYAKDKNYQYIENNAFPVKVNRKYLKDYQSFYDYESYLVEVLEDTFKGLKKEKPNDKENLNHLKVIRTFPNSNDTKIKRGNHIYINDKIQTGIDAQTFKIFNNDYAVDKNTAYVIWETGYTIVLMPLEGSKPTSFKVLGEGNAKDESSFYFQGIKIKGIKPKEGITIKKLNKHYFLYDDLLFSLLSESVVADIKPNETIEVNGDTIHTSLGRNFFKGIPYTNKNDISRLHRSRNYLTDGINVYTTKGVKINGVSPQDYYYENDYLLFKNNKALYNDTLIDIDTNTFYELNYDYAKDKNNVYFYGKKMSYDVKTFFVFNEDFALDKNGVYYQGKLLKDANPSKFNVFNDFGFDDVYFYHDGKKILKSSIKF